MEERLGPCPSTPNCVSSLAADDLHRIDPLPMPAGNPIDRIAEVVLSLPRTAIVERDDAYLHATFTSRVFRFVDDVEFLVDHDAGVVHVRSASRVGVGDLGVNRSRVEEIRKRL